MDRLQGINCSANRMGGDVRGRHRLASGAGSRASCVILPHFTSSGMRGQGSPAYVSHLKHPCIYPCLQRFDRLARA